jgi:hypothetical protein
MQTFLRLLPILITAVLTAQAAAPTPNKTSADRKVAAIQKNHWPANGAIAFSVPELIALGMEEANLNLPGVVSKPELQLAKDAATATALIDFDKLEQMRGQNSSPPDWLVSKMLNGQRKVSVSVDLTSGGGKMTVHPTRVAIAGVEVSGSALDMLIKSFVMPHYPNAVIDKPFVLPNRISHIDVNPAAAVAHRK